MALFSTPTNATATGQPNCSVARPTSADGTHRLVAVVARNYVAGTTQASTGWTQVFAQDTFDAVHGELSIWTAAGDVATLNFSSSTNSGDWKVWCGAFSGRDTEPNITDFDYQVDSGTTTSVPAMTAMLGDDAVAAWVDMQDSTSIGSTPPSSYTDSWDDGTGTFHFVVSYRTNLAAGSTGALSRSCANFTSKGAGGVLIPVAGGSGGGVGVAYIIRT